MPMNRYAFALKASRHRASLMTKSTRASSQDPVNRLTLGGVPWLFTLGVFAVMDEVVEIHAQELIRSCHGPDTPFRRRGAQS